MGRPILFISHSAYGDPSAQRTLARLQQALKVDFEILLDRDRLKGGDDWRNYLHTWMGHCDGAILLLSRKGPQVRLGVKGGYNTVLALITLPRPREVPDRAGARRHIA